MHTKQRTLKVHVKMHTGNILDTFETYSMHTGKFLFFFPFKGQNESGIAVHNGRIYLVGGYSIWTNEPLACIQVRNQELNLQRFVWEI